MTTDLSDPGDSREHTLAVRGFGVAVRNGTERSKPNGTERKRTPPVGASPWVVVFDTETTTDPSQRLRIITYQVRRGDALVEAGVAYAEGALSHEETDLLQDYARGTTLKVRTAESFVEDILLHFGYELNGTVVGFNLPFDLSRLAVAHAPARGAMRGGFSLQLSHDRRRPRIQIRHLNPRSALLQFTVPQRQRSARSVRRRGLRQPVRRGHFVDVRTLAATLTSTSHSLGSLAKLLGTTSQKLSAESHGATLTAPYLEYALADVQTTWECFHTLRVRYEALKLTTPIDRISSEASVGKAHLKEMGVQPWRELNDELPGESVGRALASYYGGRAEVHHRREVVEVAYADFLSMYPTVAALMGIWRFAIASETQEVDATSETQELLERISLDDLQQRDTWLRLPVLVQVCPNDDLFPVRTRYNGESLAIGLNYLSSDKPLWYTLADCIASKLLTGKVPTVIRAIRYVPGPPQADLRPIDLMGKPEYRVDPVQDDFYCRLIELRSEVKRRLREAKQDGDQALAEQLAADQFALKILANATSYGIFVELNVEAQSRPKVILCHSGQTEPFATKTLSMERPGRYFHPLLGALITGAARLLLATAEVLATREGVGWALCDTDSMALSRLPDVSRSEFQDRARRVTAWFDQLNPYGGTAIHEAVFKWEGVNFATDRGGQELEPLFCFAISAKRYCLFNLDKSGRPVLRKASAHGLGHLLPPYGDDRAPSDIPPPAPSLREIGVDRWEYDLWYQIVVAALEGHPDQVDLGPLPGLDQPAVSRYGATTPRLLAWFDGYNATRPEQERVRPFNFLLAFQTDPLAVMSALDDRASLEVNEQPVEKGRRRAGVDLPRAIAPFDRSPRSAISKCFDRGTGRPIDPSLLKTYRQALAQYHLHPETKFLGGGYLDHGVTRRRRIVASSVECIGKEANRWEEQAYLGLDPGAQIMYGQAPDARLERIERLRSATRCYSVRNLARRAGIDPRTLSRFRSGRVTPHDSTLDRVGRAVSRLAQATAKGS